TGGKKWAWPWPRQFWGFAAAYVQKCGARAVAIDLLFTEPSQYNGELDDDATFAASLDEVKIPLILASVVKEDGKWGSFAPPVQRKATYGAVNFTSGATVREYLAEARGKPSLAVQIARAVGDVPPDWASGAFRLHYYGRHQYADRRTTFT